MKQHPILSAMVGPDRSIHMAEYRSLSPKNCNSFRGSWQIQFHHQFPCYYFVGHASGAEPLIVQIIILIMNVTMACLFCTEIRRDSRLFSHFVPLHA
jgi:hypothetical protein